MFHRIPNTSQRILVALVGLLILLSHCPLQAAPTYRYDQTRSRDNLGPFMELYRGAALEASQLPHTDEASWSASTKVVPSFGMDDAGKNSYWVRFRIDNPYSEPVTIYLANHYPTTDHLRLYEEGPDRLLILKEEQGDQVPYKDRSVRHRFPVFRVTLAPGLHLFYLEQQSLASIQYPTVIWQADAFSAFASHENLMLGGIIGMCVFALIYNFFIFLRLKAVVYFLYVLHNLSIGIFLANFLGFTQSVILPDAAGSWWLNTGAKLNMDIVHITAISFTMVFLDLKKNAPRWRLYFLFMLGCAVLTLFNTMTLKIAFNKQTALFSMVASVSLLLASVRLWRKLSYARYYTIGWSTILLINVVTMLSLLGIVPTPITWISWCQSVGHCFELCLLSLALGERMAWINQLREETLLELTQTKTDLVAAEQERVRMQAHMLDEREQHIRDLDHKVAERTRDLQSILNNLQQGIFAIHLKNNHCFMDPDYSPFLHTIFGDFDSRTEDPVDLLFRHSRVGKDDQSRIRSILLSMVDCDRVSFELNSSSLPREIEQGLATQTLKILEIDWDPIVDGDGRIQKILVAVRDVTEYRALRSRLTVQTEDLMIARDLLREGNTASIAQVARLASDLANLMTMPKENKALLLRRLHTLKGDSRTLLLGALSEAIHEVESLWLDEHKSQDDRVHALKNASRLANRYHEIYLAFERRFQVAGPVRMDNSSSRPIKLSRLLAHELAQLPFLARELGKIPPQVQLDERDILLKGETADGLRECFGHLLRNAMDHGLEGLEERRKMGKAEQGTITIDIIERDQHWDIVVKDDGRGLQLSKLRDKAQAKGLNPYLGNDSSAAQLILEPEISTKDEVTLISGRGIGLDAVRDRLMALGGSLMVELLPNECAPGFHAFALHLRLPR